MNKALKIINQDLRDLLRSEHKLMIDGLDVLAQDIESEAVSIVPVKTGNLRDSIDVRVSGGPRYPGIIATASATDPTHSAKFANYDYAYIQHENPNYHHRGNQQYKFIEKPFNEAVDKFMEEL